MSLPNTIKTDRDFNMKYLIFAFIGFGIIAYLIDYKGVGRDFTSTAMAQNDAPIVVELYTSQSCSSCPPADKVLAEIAMQPNVIALGCHVTYWNHLHWKDTLSMEECTKRQRAFNGSINSNRVYTPQMVINGEVEFVGSRRGQAIQSIKDADAIIPVKLTKNDTEIHASFPALNINRALTVEWIGYNDKFYQEIPSGENRGRDITYSNPVQFINYSDISDGETYIFQNRTSWNKTDNLAVIIRDKTAGKVIGAGKIKL